MNLLFPIFEVMIFSFEIYHINKIKIEKKLSDTREKKKKPKSVNEKLHLKSSERVVFTVPLVLRFSFFYNVVGKMLREGKELIIHGEMQR